MDACYIWGRFFQRQCRHESDGKSRVRMSQQVSKLGGQILCLILQVALIAANDA